MSKRVTNRHFDITGMETGRVLRLVLGWKLMGLNNIAGQPALRDILELWLRQHLGSTISIITVKYERQWHITLNGLRRQHFQLRRLGNRILRRPPGSTQ